MEEERPDRLGAVTADQKYPQAGVPAQESEISRQPDATGTRRHFLGRSARKLAYISPVVMLLRPRPACASRIYS